MDKYIIAADPAEAAPGVERHRRQGGQPAGRALALCRAADDLPQARARPLPLAQVAGDGRHARHLLRAALAALGPRTGPSRPGRAARHGPQPLSSCSGSRSGRRSSTSSPACWCSARSPVPGHLGRRPRLVRLHLPADGVDRSHDRGGALLAGRPQRPHSPRPAAVGTGQDLEEGHDAPLLARHRRGHGRCLHLLLPRRADACPRARLGHGADHRLSLPRHLHAHHLRARRHRARAGVHLHVPVAAHPGRHGRPRDLAGQLHAPIAASRAGPTRRASPGRVAATASTAWPASRSAPPASTSATARSSNASSARCASTPATRSWTGSGGRAASSPTTPSPSRRRPPRARRRRCS